MFCEIWRSIHGKEGTQNANTSPPARPPFPLKAYSVCVSLLVVHIASLWNQNLNHDVFQTLGSYAVDELPPELREKAQKSNRKGIENRDCIEKNLLARNLVGSLLPLFPALSDSSRILLHICTGSESLQRFKIKSSSIHRRDGFLRTTLIYINIRLSQEALIFVKILF